MALGHRTKLTWNNADAWIWSDSPAHPAIIDLDTFREVQARLATKGAATTVRPRRSPKPYLFRGALFCGVCQRRMQGQWLRGRAYYRCRFPEQYAIANKIPHPRNVYLREDHLTPALDKWLLGALAPGQLEDTIEAMYASQPVPLPEPADPNQQIIDDCDRKIAGYRALLDEGTDPALVAGWIAETTAARAVAAARRRPDRARTNLPRMSRDQIRDLVHRAGDLRTSLRRADLAPAKAQINQQLSIRLTYHPTYGNVRVEADLDPDVAVGIGLVSEAQHKGYAHGDRIQRTGMQPVNQRIGLARDVVLRNPPSADHRGEFRREHARCGRRGAGSELDEQPRPSDTDRCGMGRTRCSRPGSCWRSVGRRCRRRCCWPGRGSPSESRST
ncbi:zinc ribbon domain-containing protein [Krasilnikovia sp. M28-CT-15]|uniref:zinc ribbon domain-containing protein n=1 Tax=Krasilnikovia sp. M28-CT-15 TaxID=3373540 RepID=UPI00399C73AE